MIGKASLHNGLYILPTSPKIEISKSFTALGKVDTVMLWHFRLGHPSFQYLAKLFPALFINKRPNSFSCKVCSLAKHTKSSYFPSTYKPSYPFALIHSDIWGPSRVKNADNFSEDGDMGPGSKQMRPRVSESIIAELTECNAALSQQRKKHQIPPTLAPVDALERYTQLSSHPLHKTNKPGISSIDINLSKDIVATGGIDSSAVLFDQTSGVILSTLSGHSKKVTSVKFVAPSNVILSGSADKTVRIWQGSEDGNCDCRHILKDHTAEVQAITVHATNNYFVTASLDSTWCFYDLSSGLCLTQVEDPSNSMGYTSAAFHPDGLILGTGTTEATVRIWDVKSQGNVANFDGHTGSITAISFSENGYFLATAAHDGVKLWDLRKLKNFRSFELYDQDTPTNSVDFDHSGSYLAIAGSDVRVYQVGSVKAEWNCIKTLPDLSGTGRATCVKFGSDAKYLAVGSMDRNLRIFGLPEGDASMES
ncbi:hypothetical protein E1A91_D01G026800v1 [Gossypium mustelinum]|uniref:Pre-mRNA-processing factor 19 n=1 Tax=Gossypium mustelinum TaxID=34275 RepID=A0A5D2W2J9_GOSMU|nr:hypothetical protein E1A91_D01G026800v1 [Gossypium mustelinum]